jgi:hypothetical protein
MLSPRGRRRSMSANPTLALWLIAAVLAVVVIAARL